MTYKKLGLIGAMNEEIELFHAHLRDVQTEERAGITFFSGLFYGKPVVVCKSGVGKVNAAVCTQLLIDRFEVDAVLFTGVAGAVDPELSIGDIVVSSESMQHDVDVTALGFARGMIPYQESSVFAASDDLRDRAFEASKRIFEGNVKIGRVLSGDRFMADRDAVKELYEQLGGSCVEMEGAAVAQVCAMYRIPYVVIRSMSDKADGSAHVNFAEFTIQASENSYRIVEEIVKGL